MSGELEAYQKQEAEIQQNAEAFNSAIIKPILDSEGGEDAYKAMSSDQKKELLGDSIKGSIFDSVGDDSKGIAVLAANSALAYKSAHGELPAAEVIAGAVSTYKNMTASEESDGRVHAIMDSATGSMNDSDGVIKRNHQVALILPSALTTITNDFVTSIPANHDKSEIFVVRNTAGSDFGDLKRGDVIDEGFAGQYSTLDQYFVLGMGDGTTKDFSFDISQTVANKEMPIRRGMIQIYHDRDLIADDSSNNMISGMLKVGGTDFVVTGSGAVDYQLGKFDISFNNAPADGVQIMARVDIDIEKAPELIPSIEHEMDSFVVRPHESALQHSLTIQAAYAARREFGLEMKAMQLMRARNVQSKEKDNKRLRDMYRTAYEVQEWSKTPAEGITKPQHYDELREFILTIDALLMQANKKAGVTHIVWGREASTLIRSLPASAFQPAPGYRRIPQPHYTGTLFGFIKCYEDPNMVEFDAQNQPVPTPWDGLCVAKGINHGDSGYVAADAISAIPFNHAILSPNQGAGKALRHSDTLYELAYRDIHPYKGRSYFQRIRFVA